MKVIADVLNSANAPKAERLKAQKAFLKQRARIWARIQNGEFPPNYVSVGNKKFVNAPKRTAIRCDFLLASKMALGPAYKKDKISNLAQKDLLFSVFRYREMFPNRTGKRFYCCFQCTGKLLECLTAKVFQYIDNAKWKAEIETADWGHSFPR